MCSQVMCTCYSFGELSDSPTITTEHGGVASRSIKTAVIVCNVLVSLYLSPHYGWKTFECNRVGRINCDTIAANRLECHPQRPHPPAAEQPPLLLVACVPSFAFALRGAPKFNNNKYLWLWRLARWSLVHCVRPNNDNVAGYWLRARAHLRPWCTQARARTCSAHARRWPFHYFRETTCASVLARARFGVLAVASSTIPGNYVWVTVLVGGAVGGDRDGDVRGDTHVPAGDTREICVGGYTVCH